MSYKRGRDQILRGRMTLSDEELEEDQTCDSQQLSDRTEEPAKSQVSGKQKKEAHSKPKTSKKEKRDGNKKEKKTNMSSVPMRRTSSSSTSKRHLSLDGSKSDGDGSHDEGEFKGSKDDETRPCNPPMSQRQRSRIRVVNAPYAPSEAGRRVVSVSLKSPYHYEQLCADKAPMPRPLPQRPLRDPFHGSEDDRDPKASSKSRPPTSRDRISRFRKDPASETDQGIGEARSFSNYPLSNDRVAVSEGQSRVQRPSASHDENYRREAEAETDAMADQEQLMQIQDSDGPWMLTDAERQQCLDSMELRQARRRIFELRVHIRAMLAQQRTWADPEVHEGPEWHSFGQFFEGSGYAILMQRAMQRAAEEQHERKQSQLDQPPHRVNSFEERWINGSDPRDDVRFDTIRAPFSGSEVKVAKQTYSGGRLFPRRGSNPASFDILGECACASDLVKSLTRPPSPPLGAAARSRSSKRSRVPSHRPPPWGLDGTSDTEVLAPAADDMTASWYYNRNSANMPAGAPGPRQLPNQAGPSQPPQMQQQQQQQQVNGVGGGGGGGQPVMIPNSLPHAGNQTDMNYLWSVVQELSDVLAHNRSQTAMVINNVQQMQARAREEGLEASTQQQTNGENYNGSSTANNALEIADLQGRLHTITRQRDELIAENEDLVRMVNDFENTLEGLMGKVREYAHDHAMAVVATHKHYNALLEQERDANLTLRIEHGQWQAGLGRAAELARSALRERSKSVEPMERRMRELKAENKVLRRLVGWTVEEDSADEEERKQEEEERRAKEEERYRMRQDGAAAAAATAAGEASSQPP